MSSIIGSLFNYGKKKATTVGQAIDSALYDTSAGIEALGHKIQSSEAYNKVSDVYGKIASSSYAQQAVNSMRFAAETTSTAQTARAVENTVENASSGALTVVQNAVSTEHAQNSIARAGSSALGGVGNPAFEASRRFMDGPGEPARQSLLSSLFPNVYIPAVRLNDINSVKRGVNVLMQDQGMSRSRAKGIMKDAIATGNEYYGLRPGEALHYRYMNTDGSTNFKRMGVDATAVAGVGVAAYGTAHYFGDD